MEVASAPAVLVIEPRYGDINLIPTVRPKRTSNTVSQSQESATPSALCDLTLGLTIDPIVTFHGDRYRHLGTIFNTGNHFWSIFPLGDRLYHCQLQPDQDGVRPLTVAAPYKTGQREKTLTSQPSLHVYVNEGSIQAQMETGTVLKDDLKGTDDEMDLDQPI